MNKVYKAIISASAAAIVAGVSIVPANVMAWGDSSNGRTTYTIEEINDGKLGKTITFNSITNGKIGDERNFVGATTNASAKVWNADTLKVKDGDKVTVRLYVHNNSPLGENNIAQGVSAQISLPTTVGKEHYVIGYLNATNAVPTRYWDEVKLTSDEDVYLKFVEGSAKYTNTQGTFSLSNEVITSQGAKLGFKTMDGQIPGCYEYDGQVTIELEVHSALTSYLSTTVRKAGTHDEFTEYVDAKVGEEVEYQIEYRNLGNAVANNVMIRDILPTNMEYVANSTYLYTSDIPNGALVKDNTLTTSGINIGSNYQPRANAYIRFRAKVVNKNLVCGTTQMVNWANVTVNGEVVKDDASVMVAVSENCTSPKPNDPKPSDDVPSTTPSTLPSTGPAEIAGAALGLGSVVTAGGYFVASKRKF